MPALLADETIVSDATSTYVRSVALEDLWIPSGFRPSLPPAFQGALPADLQEFLRVRQDGTRAIVRSMIDRVLRARSGAFSAADTVSVPNVGDHDRIDSVFSDLPHDAGHWSQSYFAHTLDPLLAAPPGYVLAAEAGEISVRDLAAEMPENVAGVSVIRTPQP